MTTGTMRRGASPIMFAIMFALLLASLRVVWAVGGTATMPLNDCGRNHVLRLDIPGQLPCDLGVVRSSQIVRQGNADSAQSAELLPEADGVVVIGEANGTDGILAQWLRFFMRLVP